MATDGLAMLMYGFFLGFISLAVLLILVVRSDNQNYLESKHAIPQLEKDLAKAKHFQGSILEDTGVYIWRCLNPYCAQYTFMSTEMSDDESRSEWKCPACGTRANVKTDSWIGAGIG